MDDRTVWDDFRAHSRTFSLATRLLPREVQLPVATLYLYCRSVDTIADVQAVEEGTDAARDALDALSDALTRTLAGHPPHGPLWPRLARVHERYDLPEGPMRDLIEGARWDLDARPIRTDADLVRYSDLVGGCVGAMMLPFLTAPGLDTSGSHTPGRHAPGLADAARALGIGMQIANIVRDVGEDRDALGRVYLPDERLRAAGIDLATLRTPSAEYACLLEGVMHLAETYFTAGLAAVDGLLPRVQPAIRAAARMYRELLNEVRANGYDDLTRRAVVPTRRKMVLVVQDDYAARRDALLRSALRGGATAPGTVLSPASPSALV